MSVKDIVSNEEIIRVHGDANFGEATPRQVVMIKELHLTKKDFKLEWFSGQGAGGQHRNKHQNCCRITHIESGLMCTGQNSRSRKENQRVAFTTLSKLILDSYKIVKDRREDGEVIRNYHAVRNEVKDKASGLIQEYTHVVIDGDISQMVDSRRMSQGNKRK